MRINIKLTPALIVLGFVISNIYSQIVITSEDVLKWKGGDYEDEHLFSPEDDSILNKNIEIGNNLTWDFSEYVDIRPAEVIVRQPNNEELTNFPNANLVEAERDLGNPDSLFNITIYNVNNTEMIILGYINQGKVINIPDTLQDTVFTFPVKFGNSKVKSNYLDWEGLVKKKETSVNSFGTFIMPGGEKISVIGQKDLIMYDDQGKDYTIYFYNFYSKKYGRIAQIYMQDVHDTSLFKAGNIYDLKEMALLTQDSMVVLSLMNSKNVSIIPAQNNKKCSLNSENYPADNAIYNVLGQKLNQSLNALPTGIFLFKLQQKDKTLKAVILKY